MLLVTMHHIVSDGWSMGVLVRELAALYAAFAGGRPSPLPELPIQYADFAAWQRGGCSGEVLASELAYWRGQLAGLPPALELPTDRPRPAVRFSAAAARLHDFAERRRRGSRAGSAARHGATLFMVLLAGFAGAPARATRARTTWWSARRSPGAPRSRSRG